MSSLVSAETFSKKKALYFTSSSCEHCKLVDDFFEKNKIFEKYDIRKIDISGPYNMEYLESFFDAFNVDKEKRGVPAVFFDADLIVGNQPIIRNFESEIGKTRADIFPEPALIKSLAENERKLMAEGMQNKKNEPVGIYVIFLSALLNSVNSCVFLVLIFIFWGIAFHRGEKAHLKFVSVFFSSMFCSYFIFGFILYKFAGIFGFPEIFSLISGIISILLGLIAFREFLKEKKFFSEKHFQAFFNLVENFYKFLNKKTSNQVGSLILGIVIGIILLPNSSKPYEIIFGILSEKISAFKEYFLLILYNIFFFIPIIVFSFIFYFLINSKKIAKLGKFKIKLLHTAYGVIMLFIGAYLVINYFL